MGSENRKRSKMVPIRLTEGEFQESKRRADDVGQTVPSYLRSIAVNGESPQFGKRYFIGVSSEVRKLNENITRLCALAQVKKISTVDFGGTKVAVEGLLKQLKDMDLKLERYFQSEGM